MLALFGDGAEYDASVVGMDVESDVAVVRIQPGRLPAARFGDSDALQVGEFVMVVGSSRGGEPTLTTGVITGLGRTVRTTANRLTENMIETDAHLTPGSSGGAIVDSRGRVVGISSASSERLHGVSLAVPANTAAWVVREILTKGRVERAYVGLAGQTVAIAPNLAERMRLGATGVLVETIVKGGPADRAGLWRGDIVVLFGARPIKTLGQLQEVLANTPPFRTVEMAALRADRLVRLNTELIERSNGP